MTAVAWGDASFGGDSLAEDLTNVNSTHCGGRACVALKADLTAVAWGHPLYGGDATTVDLTNVVGIHCGFYACVAWKTDLTAVAWGDALHGGNPSTVDLTNVVGAHCGEHACVAWKVDQTAEAWGHADFGGDASGVDLTGIVDAYCGGHACVARKTVYRGPNRYTKFPGKQCIGSGTIAAIVGTADECQVECSSRDTCTGFVRINQDGGRFDGTCYLRSGSLNPIPFTFNKFKIDCFEAHGIEQAGVAWGQANKGGDATAVDLTYVVGTHCGSRACSAWKLL